MYHTWSSVSGSGRGCGDFKALNGPDVKLDGVPLGVETGVESHSASRVIFVGLALLLLILPSSR